MSREKYPAFPCEETHNTTSPKAGALRFSANEQISADITPIGYPTTLDVSATSNKHFDAAQDPGIQTWRGIMSHLKRVVALAAFGGFTYFIYAFAQEENVTITTRDNTTVREQRRFRIGEIENASPTRHESGSTGSNNHEAPPTQLASDLATEDESSDEPQESAHQLGLRVGAAVEQMIASSRRDPSWESSVASAFDRAILTTDASVTVRQVQCSTQYCAVAFDHPHREATRELFFAARTDSALSGEALVRRDQRGDGYTTWVFVAKEGQPLPLEASGG